MYETIKKYTDKRDVSIRRVERDLNYPNGTIRNLDRSNRIPIDKVKAIAEYLGIDPYTLLLDGIDMERVQ